MIYANPAGWSPGRPLTCHCPTSAGESCSNQKNALVINANRAGERPAARPLASISHTHTMVETSFSSRRVWSQRAFVSLFLFSVPLIFGPLPVTWACRMPVLLPLLGYLSRRHKGSIFTVRRRQPVPTLPTFPLRRTWKPKKMTRKRTHTFAFLIPSIQCLDLPVSLFSIWKGTFIVCLTKNERQDWVMHTLR